MKYLIIALGLFPLGSLLAQQPDAGKLLFRASFDESPDADVAVGDRKIYTAESIARNRIRAGLHTDAVEWKPSGGLRGGGALHFTKATKQLVFFKGGKNVPYRKDNFEGTVSLWMRLSPQDLPKGFVDPLQITDKKWNDASFFVDFDQAASREFRLGAFADFKSWNPGNRKFEEIPVTERPMVSVKQAPFTADKWTHVKFRWAKLNRSEPGRVELHIDDKLQGAVEGEYFYTWKPEDVVIMLGINYVGWIDEVEIRGAN